MLFFMFLSSVGFIMLHICLYHFRESSPGYDTKQIWWWGFSDAEALGNAEYSLPLLPGPLWPRVVALDRVLSRGKIQLLDI